VPAKQIDQFVRKCAAGCRDNCGRIVGLHSAKRAGAHAGLKKGEKYIAAVHARVATLASMSNQTRNICSL
jgi:hypothetical protein